MSLVTLLLGERAWHPQGDYVDDGEALSLTDLVGAEGTTLAGRYRLERLLAEGAMGQVWVARHLTLDIPVAVKLMAAAPASDRAALRARFELEAKAIAQLKSPHIIQILDFGTEQDAPFIVMEFLTGSDLLSLITRRPRWPLSEVSDVVTQVCKGLATAHERGIIHRDIKPGNIFLSRSASDTIVKLLDFGIAKWLAADQNLTETGAVLGSPYYMAPEQVRGDPLDFRVDLWALSVVAYRLAAGGLPFEGRDGLEVAERVIAGVWTPVPPQAPRARQLQLFFERAFNPTREARFSSAIELAKAFVVIAGPPTPAWTGDGHSAAGENTVTILRPRLSQIENLEDAISVDELATSRISHHPGFDGERSAEVITAQGAEVIAAQPSDITTQRMRQAPVEELQAHLGLASPPTETLSADMLATRRLPPRAEMELIRSLASSAPQPPAWSSPQTMNGPPQTMNGGYFPANTTGYDHPSFRGAFGGQNASRRPSAVVISLVLCGLLVAAIAVWIAVNVASGSATEQESHPSK